MGSMIRAAAPTILGWNLDIQGVVRHLPFKTAPQCLMPISKHSLCRRYPDGNPLLVRGRVQRPEIQMVSGFVQPRGHRWIGHRHIAVQSGSMPRLS